jgi:Prolipoprotein diacylglyceryltransferase
VIANWDYFSTAPGEIARIDHGGLIFYGGFVAACLALAAYARIRKLPPVALFDFAATGLAIGHAFGRFGCLAFGCCHGAPLGEGVPRWLGLTYPEGTPMGQEFPGIPLYATQLIEALGLVALWVALLAFRAPLRKRPGLTSAIYLLAYAPLRFGVEFLRGDVRQPGWFGLDVAQTVSLGLFVLGGILLALALSGRCGKAAEA